MGYSYVAINKKSGECFAIHSADPKFMGGFESVLKKWERLDAEIKILPRQEATDLFCKYLVEKKQEKQMELF